MTMKKGVVPYLFPDEWDIRIRKGSGGLWRMEYVERFREPDRELVEETAGRMRKLLKTAMEFVRKEGIRMDVRVEHGDDHIKVVMEAPLEAIANAIASEFISVAPLGDLTIRDLLYLTHTQLLMLVSQMHAVEFPQPSPPPKKEEGRA